MAHLDADSGSAASAAHSRVIDMVQLDAIDRSAAAGDDHRQHVIDMSRLDKNVGSAAAAVDGHIDDRGIRSTGSDDVPSCVVCTEPLEWVAVGLCVHRAVCSACAARLCSAPNSDKRCCICRTICPTIVVTKAAGVVTFSTLPAATNDGRVGEYWYCAAVSAYFDDEQQYEAAKVAVPRQRAQEELVALVVLLAALFGMIIGSIFASAIAGNEWNSGVVVSVGEEQSQSSSAGPITRIG